jgi:hypothetical protein
MRTFNTIAALAALTVLPGLTIAAEAQDAGIVADFQPVVDGALTIAEVAAPDGGFLVVWLPKDNKPFRGRVIAAVPVEAGVHADLKVPLDEEVGPDQTLGIVLHQDTGEAGKFEFELGKEVDLPVMNGRRPVMEVIGTIE